MALFNILKLEIPPITLDIPSRNVSVKIHAYNACNIFISMLNDYIPHNTYLRVLIWKFKVKVKVKVKAKVKVKVRVKVKFKVKVNIKVKSKM